MVNFTQACSLAFQSAQIKQLGATNLVGAGNFHFVQHLGVEWEDTLHTLAKADFADGKAALRAAAHGDNGAFKSLHALFLAFFDPDLHADAIARLNRRNIVALQLGSQFFHDGML